MSSTLTVDTHLTDDDLRSSLEADARQGLTSSPKVLLPKYFYDDKGSELFDEITRLPEYYPTRREKEILVREGAAIALASGADTLVELGSGTSEKTRLLLDALRSAGTLKRFIPFDVSEGMLRSAAAAVDVEYPGIEVHAVVGDFERHLSLLPRRGRRLVAFLGGTIGNLGPAPRAAFLADLASGLDEGDTLLLGTDLVKDPARLVRAYDDSAGVTAAFNKNILVVLNRALDADFDPERFDHVSLWNEDESRIEMHLRSQDDQTVHLRGIDLTVTFAAGETMRTEVSSKFTRERVAAELDHAGFDLTQWWTDDADDYALSLSTRRG